MARTSVTTQKIVHAGLIPVLTAPAGTGAANGDIIDAGYKSLVVACGATGTTVTVEVPVLVDGLPVGPLTVVVAANTTVEIGPFNPSTFAQTAATAGQSADVGRVYIDYSSVATCTRAVKGF